MLEIFALSKLGACRLGCGRFAESPPVPETFALSETLAFPPVNEMEAGDSF